MGEAKPRDNFRFVVVLLCVVMAVAFTAIAYSFEVNSLENQINDLQAARLINVNLGYTDLGQGTLNVTGHVCNAGNTTAYGCRVHVVLIRAGEVVNSSTVFFGSNPPDPFAGASILSGASSYVNSTVTYTGAPPTNVTFTLEWEQPWQIPIA
jgi:hypothetical protein